MSPDNLLNDASTASETNTVSYISDLRAGHGARMPARSWLRTDAPEISLNGDWHFRLLPGAPGTPGCSAVLPDGEAVEGVAEESFDDSGWDAIAVPSHWVLGHDGKYGRPIYTNVQFPFPVDPPHVPDANPTGDYRRHFVIPAEWLNGTGGVVLRFDGVESRYKVWVNGLEIGVGSGSRLAQEFDVSGSLRVGKNLIVVRVHQWSAASYLEDQDQWWLPGIFRDVTLVSRPAAGLYDVWLRTQWLADFGATQTGTGTGTIDAEITADLQAFPVTLRVPELGVEVRWNTPADVVPLSVENVRPWSAEIPRLYQATVSTAAETLSLKLGFRTVEIKDGLFLVNGRRVLFHGVNRHETHPDRGRVFNEEDARADLKLMKRFNINAIRTSHYPPHPRLLDLADELGFWVILECDLETHGFEAGGWAKNPSDDPAWRDAYLDRMERTLERDKNHASIVMWSLGNESGTGANLAAMSVWVHARDAHRPVHYEGDYTGSYTDVYSRMYSSIPETDSIGRDDSRSLLLGCTATESARQRSKPFMLCEYVHAMGNGPGAIDQYEDLTDKYPRLHGGFVWEWRDHGIRTRTADGTEFFAYGGDFGEVIHDSNFVMDGMILSDSTPTPGLHEYKAVVAPIRLRFIPTDAGVSLLVSNLRHSADTSDIQLRWRLEGDGVLLSHGMLDVGVLAPGAASTLALTDVLGQRTDRDDTDEIWLTVEAALRHDTPWAPAGHVISVAQFDVTEGTNRRSSAVKSRTPRPSPTVLASGSAPGSAPRAGVLELGPARFNAGQLTALNGLAVKGPRLELWRAPTDNDNGNGFGSYDAADPWENYGRGVPAPARSSTWKDAGLDRLTGRVEEVATLENGLRRLTRYAAADRRATIAMEENWQFVDGQLWLRVDITPSTGWDVILPRIGVSFDLPLEVAGASWFGTGPLESYPDSMCAALVGRYQASVEELSFPYAKPQETGHRSDMRSVDLLRDGGPWLRIDAEPDAAGRLPGFTLSHHTPGQIAAAAHPHELPAPTHTHLLLDAAQHGLGSRACGPDVWPDFALRPEARTLVMAITALKAD
ncbi:glycoside hydrolase family 2 TIM barrel-domain containing protein [Arthrobacter cryoconiti]|uniref:Beta-galactosidase n=1 Tax=Arthrobacter cryoconiti TaxID=748907 RepID=A0ABV8QZH4_9MICC|nr:glycoside hydrolase family 2 TIM barrel-domain containing protein [Arthrobacter cryoconiti]MCC9069273.1 DUF4981 domain-containing protein [Arthrobacter cryoconiti]